VSGEPARDGIGRLAMDGKTLDALGAELRFPRALTATSEHGAVHASLLDAVATTGLDRVAADPAYARESGAGAPWRWLVLAALALLLLEWWLVRSERIP